MKSYSHSKVLEPIEPDKTLVPDMSFSDRAPTTGILVSETTLERFARLVAAHNLYHYLLELEK